MCSLTDLPDEVLALIIFMSARHTTVTNILCTSKRMRDAFILPDPQMLVEIVAVMMTSIGNSDSVHSMGSDTVIHHLSRFDSLPRNDCHRVREAVAHAKLQLLLVCEYNDKQEVSPSINDKIIDIVRAYVRESADEGGKTSSLLRSRLLAMSSTAASLLGPGRVFDPVVLHELQYAIPDFVLFCRELCVVVVNSVDVDLDFIDPEDRRSFYYAHDARKWIDTIADLVFRRLPGGAHAEDDIFDTVTRSVSFMKLLDFNDMTTKVQ